jgi:hypothetical protein
MGNLSLYYSQRKAFWLQYKVLKMYAILLLAALGVFGTGTGWPDILIAAIIATLALQGAGVVLLQSASEPRTESAVPAE